MTRKRTVRALFHDINFERENEQAGFDFFQRLIPSLLLQCPSLPAHRIKVNSCRLPGHGECCRRALDQDFFRLGSTVANYLSFTSTYSSLSI